MDLYEKKRVEMMYWDLILLGHGSQADLLPYFMKLLEGIDKLSIIKVSIDRTILSVKIFLFFVLHVNDLQMV